MLTADLSRAKWRKSTYSSDNGNCVEVADWRKASFSGNNGNCVEAGTTDQAIAVRDSQDPNGTSLVFEPSAWCAFAATLKGAAVPA